MVFSVGHARDPVINYTLGHGNYQYRHPYFLSRYETVEDAVSVHEQRFESMTDKYRCRSRLLSKTTPIPCPERIHSMRASTQKHQRFRATIRPLRLSSCDKYSKQLNGQSRKTTMGSTTNRTLLCSSKVSSWLVVFIQMLRCIESEISSDGVSLRLLALCLTSIQSECRIQALQTLSSPLGRHSCTRTH